MLNFADDGTVVEEDEEPAGASSPLQTSSSTDVAMADEDTSSVPILRSSAQDWDEASMASTSSDK